jgi:hypothetical protein
MSTRIMTYGSAILKNESTWNLWLWTQLNNS